MVTLSLTLLAVLSLAITGARKKLAGTPGKERALKAVGALHPFLVVGLLAGVLGLFWPVALTSGGFLFYLSLPLVVGLMYGFAQWRRRHPGAISGALAHLVLGVLGLMMGRRRGRGRRPVQKKVAPAAPSRPYLRSILPSWVNVTLGEDKGPWCAVQQLSVLAGALLALNLPDGTLFTGDSFLLPLAFLIVPFFRWRAADSDNFGKILKGNQLLFDTKILKTQDVLYEKVWLETGELKSVLHVDEPIPGVPTSQLTNTLAKFTDHMNAVRTRVTRPSASSVLVEFYHVEPLDEPVVISEPLELDPKKMRITCAVNSLGEPVTLTLGDSSGMVIGGIPGSGKTAGATSFLLPLALSPYVDMSIIDGKGGEDWVNYRGAVSRFIKGDEDLVPIYEYIKQFNDEMYARLDGLKAKLGTSNFWNATPQQRLDAGVKLKLLVIDECQGVFQSRKDKTERDNGMTDQVMISEITRMIEGLIKRGRSAGAFVILMTQKPTADSMPTAIRDNAGLRIAFHVQSQAAEQSILGVTSKDVPDMPSATKIPGERKGCAVLATETGEYEMVRFYYMPEQEQEKVLLGAGRPQAPHGEALIAGSLAEEPLGEGQGEWPQVEFEPATVPDEQPQGPAGENRAEGGWGQGQGAPQEQVPLPFTGVPAPPVGPDHRLHQAGPVADVQAAPAAPVEPPTPVEPTPAPAAAAPAPAVSLPTTPEDSELSPWDWDFSQTPAAHMPAPPAPAAPVATGEQVWGGVGQGEVLRVATPTAPEPPVTTPPAPASPATPDVQAPVPATPTQAPAPVEEDSEEEGGLF